MNEVHRRKLQSLLLSLTGLELWLIGESELPKTVDDDLAQLHLRLVIYQTILKQIRSPDAWHADDSNVASEEEDPERTEHG